LYFDITVHNLKVTRRYAYKILIVGHEGKQRIGRLTSRLEDDNIKTDSEDIRCEYVKWINLIYDTVRWRDCADGDELSGYKAGNVLAS
jgi:hypothetical protein